MIAMKKIQTDNMSAIIADNMTVTCNELMIIVMMSSKLMMIQLLQKLEFFLKNTKLFCE